MTKFKAGDRVRFNPGGQGRGYNAHAGSLATVGPQGMFRQYVDIIWDADVSGQSNGGYFPDMFERVEPEFVPTAPLHPVTKLDKIKAHLLSGRSITQLEALALYGAFRLAARVHELKAKGWKIVTKIKEDPNGSTYAEYSLRKAKGRG